MREASWTCRSRSRGPRSSKVPTTSRPATQSCAAFPKSKWSSAKAGRAETPTDPAPLDMIETVVNLHPKEFWPKRHMRYEDDAKPQAGIVLQLLEDQGPRDEAPNRSETAHSLVDPATMNAITRARQDATRVRVTARPTNSKPNWRHDLPHDVCCRIDRAVGRKHGRLLRPVSPTEIDSLAGESSAHVRSPVCRRCGPGGRQSPRPKDRREAVERRDREADARALQAQAE